MSGKQIYFFDEIVDNYSVYLNFRYHNIFYGSLNFRGRKQFAYRMFCKIKYRLKILERKDPFFIFSTCMAIITPSIYLIQKRLGRIKMGVPLPISEYKQAVFAVKWIVKLLRDENKLITITDTVDLIIASLRGKGLALKKKKEIESIALKNRYLLRYIK